MTSIPALPSVNPSARSHSVSLLLPPADMRLHLQAALPWVNEIEWVERTVSTNLDLYERARAGNGRLARPWLLGAHLQEQGRGRAGRSWQNRSGANLMFSCAFDVFLPPHQLPALSPLAGLAICSAMREALDPEHRPLLAMKWPNDILWRNAKLAGILVEVTRAGTARLAADHHVVIIGIGINLDDARALSQSLNRRVADWAEITRLDGRAATVTAAGLIARIAQSLYAHINDVVATGFDRFPAAFAQVDALAGQHIHITDGGQLVHAGVACGVNSRGQLIVRNPAGNHAITVGDVSVQPATMPSMP